MVRLARCWTFFFSYYLSIFLECFSGPSNISSSGYWGYWFFGKTAPVSSNLAIKSKTIWQVLPVGLSDQLPQKADGKQQEKIPHRMRVVWRHISRSWPFIERRSTPSVLWGIHPEPHIVVLVLHVVCSRQRWEVTSMTSFLTSSKYDVMYDVDYSNDAELLRP